MNNPRAKGAQTLEGQSHPALQARAQLEHADELRQQGQLDRAESICHALTQQYPNYTAALHTLGLTYLDKQNHDRALHCLVRAQMLDPDNWMILAALGLCHMRLGADDVALRELQRALAIRPDEAGILATLGEVHRNRNEFELAETAYRHALKLDGSLESSTLGLALCLSALGRHADAGAALQAALRQGHRSTALLYAAASLPRKVLSIDVLNILDLVAATERAPDAEFKNTLAFARSAALHAAERHAEAWDCLHAANRPMAVKLKSELQADHRREENSLARLRSVPPGSKIPAKDPAAPVTLLILGASRSGKSSLELLLSGFDEIRLGYETPIVECSLHRACQANALPPLAHLEELPPEFHDAFREYYLDELQRRSGSSRVYTCTLAHCIHDAGILAAVVPNVRFVLLGRNRMDAALRIYMTKYMRGNAYSYDLRSISQHLQWYEQMMGLLAEKFPKIALAETYESVIANPAGIIQKLSDLTGIAGIAGIAANPTGAVELIDDRDAAKAYQELMNRT